jgi:glycosyltransferase involved in cell wall biosynthesis
LYLYALTFLKLLQSVQRQSVYPDEILVLTVLPTKEAKISFKGCNLNNLKYFLVPSEHRGLTKQRNYGIERVGDEMEVVCFLDDDTV